MKTARRILLPLWALLSALPAIAHADNYHLMIQEYAPFTHTDPKSGEIRGMVTEKIQEILRMWLMVTVVRTLIEQCASLKA